MTRNISQGNSRHVPALFKVGRNFTLSSFPGLGNSGIYFDMGLGKTIEIIAYLLNEKKARNMQEKKTSKKSKSKKVEGVHR